MSDAKNLIFKLCYNDVPFTLPCQVKAPALNHNNRSNMIIVDHLAWSMSLSCLKNLERAGSDATKRYQWEKMPTLKSLPKKPSRITELENKSDEQITQSEINELSDFIKDFDYSYNQALERFNSDSFEVLVFRMQQFCEKILGLKMSAPRDKGLHGYQNSFRLTDLSGRVELGFIGIGGNSGTVYFQISGTGCKHVFEKISHFSLHFWIAKVLQVTKLARIDLAYDDFDGNFDCVYAEKAYFDGAFQGFMGGPMPSMIPSPEYKGDKIIGYIVRVGKRSANTFWRIYDKAAEQGLKEQVWFRSEVELKRCNVNALENPALAFAGINAFSASINIEHGCFIRTSVKRVCLDMAGRIKWLKQQCGRTLSDLLETLDGDIGAAFGLLIDERGGKFSIPDTHSHLLNTHIREIENYENANNWL